MGGLMKIDEITAKAIIDKVFEGMDAIHVSARHVGKHCDGDTFSDYQAKAAVLISSIEEELLKPMYRLYPNLRPY
jgi:hypothetical protein